MVGFLKNIFLCSVLFSLLFVVSACDSGSGKNAESADDELSDATIAEEVDFVAPIYEDLPVCTDNRVGSTAYVKDEKKAYVCNGDDWTEDASLTDLIEQEQEDKSSDKAKSSSGKNSDSTEKSGDSSAVSSSSRVLSSSSSVILATPCSNIDEDNCEYGTLSDERDGRIYKTVKIGDQWWMAENLNYEVADDHYTIKYRCGYDKSQYSGYDKSQYNCENDGRLYSWAEAMDSAGVWSENGKGCSGRRGLKCEPIYPVRGICPSGWHLPSKTEWETLIASVRGSGNVSGNLRTRGNWHNSNYISINYGGFGTDKFGFSALPIIFESGLQAEFWSSYRDDTTTYSVGRSVGIGGPVCFYLDDYDGYNGMLGGSAGLVTGDLVVSHFHIGGKDNRIAEFESVRCLKDSATPIQNYIRKACKNDGTDTCEYGLLTDDRDGQTYKTVKIGPQVWMAENLNFETENSECFHDSAIYCSQYGRFYTWTEAMNACPDGWHLPAVEAFDSLAIAVGGRVVAGKMLLSADNGGVDAYGFGAFGIGFSHRNGHYNIDSLSRFWTSSEYQKDSVYMVWLSNWLIYATDRKDSRGYTVRCVKE